MSFHNLSHVELTGESECDECGTEALRLTDKCQYMNALCQYVMLVHSSEIWMLFDTLSRRLANKINNRERTCLLVVVQH